VTDKTTSDSSDSKPTSQILDEISKSTKANPGSRARQQRNARRRFLVVLVLLLPILAVTGFVAFQQWQQQSRFNELVAQNQQLNNTLVSQSSLINQLQQQVARVPDSVPLDTAEITAVENRLRDEITRLNQALAQLQQRQQSQQAQPTEINLGWKLREADYLVNLASRRLQLEHDVITAIALLVDADEALQTSGNNSVLAAREALATDIATLRSTDVLDRDGLYLRMGTLLNNLEQLDLLDSMRQSFEARRDTQSQPLSNRQGVGVVDASLNFLSSVFVWRRWEETPEAMLAPGQEALIKQNLRLMLEQARLALLARDTVLYRTSLNNILAELDRYSVTDVTADDPIRSELNELLTVDIDQTLPNVSSSSALIAQLVANEL